MSAGQKAPHHTTPTCSELPQGPSVTQSRHGLCRVPKERTNKQNTPLLSFAETPRKANSTMASHFPFNPKATLFLNSVVLYASWRRSCQSKQLLQPLWGLKLFCRKCMFVPYRRHIIHYNHCAKWHKLGDLKVTFGNLPLLCSNYSLISQFKGSILAPFINCLAFMSLCHRINVEQFSDSLLKTADSVLPDKAKCLH